MDMELKLVPNLELVLELELEIVPERELVLYRNGSPRQSWHWSWYWSWCQS